jgi:dCMP deaminase
MRPDWDAYFVEMAVHAATRSSCCRKQVGAVLVRNHRVLSTGYAGSVRGQPHCLDVGCDIGPDGGCQRTVHAEMNAVAQAAANGVSTEGATCYCTLLPCYVCFKLLANAGVVRIVYREPYRITRTIEEAARCGIECVQASAP